MAEAGIFSQNHRAHQYSQMFSLRKCNPLRFPCHHGLGWNHLTHSPLVIPYCIIKFHQHFFLVCLIAQKYYLILNWCWLIIIQVLWYLLVGNVPGGRFKKAYELLNLRALKFSPLNKIHIFQCMGKIFCVEFQRYPLKFHTKYLTHTLKGTIFIQHWNFKSS